jgi:hypothetical protein
MNGVLSDRTWGTWDALYCAQEPPTDAATASTPPTGASPLVSRERSKKKLQRKRVNAPKASQLWFVEVLGRIDGDAFGATHCAYRCNPLRCLHDGPPLTSDPVIPWDSLPQGIHPRDGKLPQDRVRRKRHQVENLAVFLQRLLR